eukprot:scaffold797_cov236-Pinguiococcus_pyrenoidosus.AAC.13
MEMKSRSAADAAHVSRRCDARNGANSVQRRTHRSVRESFAHEVVCGPGPPDPDRRGGSEAARELLEVRCRA